MKRSIIIIALIATLISACSTSTPTPAPVLTAVPQVMQPTATAVPPTATEVPPSATPAPTPTSTPASTLFPTVVLTASVACRMGPDLNYYRVVNFPVGQTTQAQGRSDDSKWLNVITQTANKSYTCWIPVESVKTVAGLTDMRVVPTAPLPTGPSSAVVRQRPYCGVNKDNGSVVIDWSPYAEGTGFIIYRNGKNITTVYGGEYIDHNTPASKTAYTLEYTIQAFSSVGLSKVSASVSIKICD